MDGGELVPLDRSLIDCSQSSIESMDPLKLFVRCRFGLMSSYVDSLSFFRFIDDVGGSIGDVVDDDDVDDTDDNDDEDVDCVNFRLHLDCPVSRNPLANGLLSIFNFVIRSFCNERENNNKCVCRVFVRGKKEQKTRR